MTVPINDAEARFALGSIDERRRQVIAEIDMPSWYWPALAAGWVVLGVISDYAPPWVDIAATVLFGLGHASVAPRILSGRRGSSRLSVHGELVDHRLPVLIVGLLITMVGITIALALLLHADGARHPATWASLVVAATVLAAGPALMGAVRRRADAQHGS